MSSARPVLRRAALALGAGVAAAIGFDGVSSYIRSQIFRPGRSTIEAVTRDGVGFEVVTVGCQDGTVLSGLAGRASGRKAVLLVLHGNAGSAVDGTWQSAGLVKAGFDVLLAEYRGYGGNPGAPSQAGLVQDATAFLERARSMAEGKPLLVAGHSLGGALAILVAATSRIDGLATFGAVARVSDFVPPIGRPFLRDAFDALAVAPGITVPWIVAHGEADDIVPVEDARRLAASAPGRELDLLPGRGHDLDAATLEGLVERLYGMVARG